MNLPKGTAVAECVILPKIPEIRPGVEGNFPRMSADVPVGTTVVEVNSQPDVDLPPDFPEVLKP